MDFDEVDDFLNFKKLETFIEEVGFRWPKFLDIPYVGIYRQFEAYKFSKGLQLFKF